MHALIHHELTPGTSASFAETSAISSGNVTSRPSEEQHNRSIHNVEPQPSQPATPSSEEIQRVFDVAPLNVTNKRRRLVITTLIVACNLMQMICNMLGVAGGLAVSERLGVSGVHANWVGASYPYVNPYSIMISKVSSY